MIASPTTPSGLRGNAPVDDRRGRAAPAARDAGARRRSHRDERAVERSCPSSARPRVEHAVEHVGQHIEADEDRRR